MNSFVVAIKPKKTEFDPLARQIRHVLMEHGEPSQNAIVQTEKLFKIEGDLSTEQIAEVTQHLLVDPVVETSTITQAGKGAKPVKEGFTLDIWPKKGVTDPVGETVEKGLRDFGFRPPFHASSAIRYIFPKIKNDELLRQFAIQFLANELIHDIDIQKNN